MFKNSATFCPLTCRLLTCTINHQHSQHFCLEKRKENIPPGRQALQDALYRGTCSAADSWEDTPYHIYLGRYINGYEGGKAHDGSLAGGLPVVAPQDLENNAQATLRAKYNT